MKDKKPSNQHSTNSKGGDSEFGYIEPVYARPLEVKVRDSFERAVRIFRALVQKERTISTYKEKQSYEKPSDKKRRKRSERKRKLLELNSKEDFFAKKDKKVKKEKDQVKGSSKDAVNKGESSQ